MPRIPEYTQRVGEPRPQGALPRVDLPRPDQPLDDRIAREAAQFVGELGKVAQEEEERALAAWTAEQKTALIRNKNDLLDDPEKGLYSNNYRGKDSGRAHEHIQARVERFYKKQNQGNLTPQQREILRALQSENSADLDTAISRHIRTEMNRHEVESLSEFQQETMGEIYREPHKAKQKIAEITAVGNRIARTRGLTGEARKAYVDRMVSAGHLLAISGFVDNKDVDRAREYFNKNKEHLRPQDHRSAGRMVEYVETEQKAQSYADGIRLKAKTRKEAFDAAYKIKDPEDRKATVDALTRFYRSEDFAHKSDQESLYQRLRRRKDKGQRITTSELMRLDAQYRDALKWGFTPRKISDWNDYSKLYQKNMQELSQMTPTDIEVATSRMTPADQRFFQKRHAMAQKGEFGFISQKKADNMLVAKGIDAGLWDNYKDIKKGRQSEHLMRLRQQVSEDEVAMKRATGKENLSGKDYEDIISRVISNQVMVEKGILYWKKLVPTQADDPRVDPEDVPEFMSFWETYAKERGYDSDDKQRMTEFWHVYVDMKRGGR